MTVKGSPMNDEKGKPGNTPLKRSRSKKESKDRPLLKVDEKKSPDGAHRLKKKITPKPAGGS